MSETSPIEMMNIVKGTLVEQDYIVGIFIYGNFLKSEVTLSSEIEIFILVANPSEIDNCRNTVQAIEKMLKIKINPVIWSVSEIDKPDNALVQVVFREGKMIYWNSLHDFPASQIFKVKPHTIFTFSLKKLNQLEKAKFNYNLYGKSNKIGFLDTLGGKRLSKSCFYVPYANKFKVSRYLSNLSVDFETKECWI